MARKKNEKNIKKAFYVVEFIELPFKGIEKYVCVPRTWIIVRLANQKKAVIAYPKNEDPTVTKDRVKRKEVYDSQWRYYVAVVQHESDTYTDAEHWIAARNEYGPLFEEESNITDTPKLRNANQSKSSKSNNNPRKPLPRISIKRPLLSEPKKQLDGKRLKTNVAAQSSSTVVNDANAVPGCSKWIQSTTIQESPLESSQTEENEATSNESTEERTQAQRTEGNKEALSLPVLDADEPNEFIIKEEDVETFDEFSINQSYLSNNTMTASMTAAKPSTSVEQTTQPNQHNSQEHILDSGSPQSKFQPQIINVRSIANDHNDYDGRVNEISNNEISSPPDILDSLKRSAHLYHMKGAQCSVPNEKRVENKIPFMNINRNLTIAAHNPSNLMDQNIYLSPRSVEQQSVIVQNQSHDGPQVLKMHTGNGRDQTAPPKRITINSQEIQRVPKVVIERCDVIDPRIVLQSVTNIAPASQNLSSSSHQHPSFDQRLDGQQSSPTQAQYLTRSHQNQCLPTNQDSFKQNLLRGSTERNNYDHYSNPRTNSMRISSIEQNSTNPTDPTSELPQQRQTQSNLQDSQRQLQRSKIHDIAIKPQNNRQMSSLQGVMKKTPPPILKKVVSSEQEALRSTHNIYLLNERQLQARLNAQSTLHNHTCVTTSPQNIAASATRDERNSEMPSCSFYQSPRIQNTKTHETVYQNLHFSERVNSERANPERKRVHFMDDVRSPTIESRRNVMDNGCQTDESMVEEPLSQYNTVMSDSENVRISENVMSTNEPPVETMNNVYYTATSAESSSADIPTAAQNSTSPNQTDPRVVLEQQMLDSFASLFTQMGSTLRYTCDMYNNLRKSIFETAVTYKTLLDAVERFNTLGNSASNPSPLSNLTPEVPQATQASRTEVTARASSTNENQHSNNAANTAATKQNNLALPPEYDPHDTRWTLKYPTIFPGLIELMPPSGTYVHYGELKYCQEVSKDCKSLARRLLLEVFNRRALSVCLSMSEKAQASDNVGSSVRPALDGRASAALLNYVLDHGLRRGWNTDLQPILTTLHNEIQEIRLQYS